MDEAGMDGPAPRLRGQAAWRAVAGGFWRAKSLVAAWLGFGCAWLAASWIASAIGAACGVGLEWGWARSAITWGAAGIELLLACACPLLASPAPRPLGSPRSPWLGGSRAGGSWHGEAEGLAASEAKGLAIFLWTWLALRLIAPWIFSSAPAWVLGLGAFIQGGLDLAAVGFAGLAWLALGASGCWELWRGCVHVDGKAWRDAERGEIARATRSRGKSSMAKRL